MGSHMGSSDMGWGKPQGCINNNNRAMNTQWNYIQMWSL